MSKEKKDIKKIVNKVFTGIMIGITAVLVFVVGWLCVDKYICKATVPSFMGYSSLTVATGSMSGTIEQGDFIIVKKTNDYKIGDIITYAHPGEKIPTTHRIIQITPEGKYITKGDANNAEDKLFVSKEEIVGEVVSVWHYFGVFVGWLLNGGGFVYIIAVLLIVALAIYLFKKPKEVLVIDNNDKTSEEEDSSLVETPKQEAEPVIEVKIVDVEVEEVLEEKKEPQMLVEEKVEVVTAVNEELKPKEKKVTTAKKSTAKKTTKGDEVAKKVVIEENKPEEKKPKEKKVASKKKTSTKKVQEKTEIKAEKEEPKQEIEIKEEPKKPLKGDVKVKENPDDIKLAKIADEFNKKDEIIVETVEEEPIIEEPAVKPVRKRAKKTTMYKGTPAVKERAIRKDARMPLVLGKVEDAHEFREELLDDIPDEYAPMYLSEIFVKPKRKRVKKTTRHKGAPAVWELAVKKGARQPLVFGLKKEAKAFRKELLADTSGIEKVEINDIEIEDDNKVVSKKIDFEAYEENYKSFQKTKNDRANTPTGKTTHKKG